MMLSFMLSMSLIERPLFSGIYFQENLEQLLPRNTSNTSRSSHTYCTAEKGCCESRADWWAMSLNCLIRQSVGLYQRRRPDHASVQSCSYSAMDWNLRMGEFGGWFIRVTTFGTWCLKLCFFSTFIVAICARLQDTIRRQSHSDTSKQIQSQEMLIMYCSQKLC